jgi:hypothetical protein
MIPLSLVYRLRVMPSLFCPLTGLCRLVTHSQVAKSCIQHSLASRLLKSNVVLSTKLIGPLRTVIALPVNRSPSCSSCTPLSLFLLQ